MPKAIELLVDVSKAAELGIAAHTAVTVHVPDGPLAEPPVVCFAFPGGGYCRRYYSFDLPPGAGDRGDCTTGGQAGFHCARGWIVVACDHLGFGDSTVPEGNALTLDNVAAANDATVRELMRRLESGELASGLAPVRGAMKLGIGQSMGGCFTIVAQGQYSTFDAIGILGYSAIHTVVPTRPGNPPIAWPWISRRSSLDRPQVMNRAIIAKQQVFDPAKIAASGEHPFQWSFHFEDEPAEIVALDMAAASGDVAPLPAWRSATTPPCGIYMLAPGAVALEAAVISVPVLVAVGERDVVPNPRAEPAAYKSADDISVLICPRMAHMHNFASTRELFWQRVHDWGSAIAASRPTYRGGPAAA